MAFIFVSFSQIVVINCNPIAQNAIAEVGRGAGSREQGAGGINNKDSLMKWGNLFSGNPKGLITDNC
jgi:hypothetical protein